MTQWLWRLRCGVGVNTTLRTRPCGASSSPSGHRYSVTTCECQHDFILAFLKLVYTQTNILMPTFSIWHCRVYKQCKVTIFHYNTYLYRPYGSRKARYTCMYTRTQCTVADYFCQEMQLKNFGHFYRAPVFKIPLPIQTFGTRLFSAFAHYFWGWKWVYPIRTKINKIYRIFKSIMLFFSKNGSRFPYVFKI